MIIAATSDTHGYHADVVVPKCDVLIHAGDFCKNESTSCFIDFLRWFEAQKVAHKIFVAGNHDRILESNPGFAGGLIREFCPSAIYLQDQGIEIGGFKFWGSPVQPAFFNWAFNRNRGSDIRRHWDMIPDDTDVLITHGPPVGLLDKTQEGDTVGCRDLYEAVLKVKPYVHVFGHIHYSYGAAKLVHDNGDKTRMFNCSFVGEDYKPQNHPHVFEP